MKKHDALGAGSGKSSDLSISTADGDELSLEAFAHENPLWFKKLDAIVALTRHIKGDKPELRDHPAFAPWKQAVLQTGSRNAPLKRAKLKGKPASGMSFCGGTTAFLEETKWPLCKVCKGPLGMCFQMAPDLLAPWLKTKKSLVGMYCFACNPDSTSEKPGAIFLALVLPEHEVKRVDEEADEASALTLEAPGWGFPDTSWLNFRSELGGVAGAFSAMAGGTITRGTQTVEVDAEYNGWVFPQGGYATTLIPPTKARTDHEWRSVMGGYPSWDQADATPKCRKCKKQMEFLLDYNGGQFVDGAMHVFICDRGACAKNIQLAAAVEF